MINHRQRFGNGEAHNTKKYGQKVPFFKSNRVENIFARKFKKKRQKDDK